MTCKINRDREKSTEFFLFFLGKQTSESAAWQINDDYSSMNNSRERGSNSLSDLCTEYAPSPSANPSAAACGDYNESWSATAAFIAKVVSYVNEMRFGFAFGYGFRPFLLHFGFFFLHWVCFSFRFVFFFYFLHCLRCRLHCAKMFGVAVVEGEGARAKIIYGEHQQP